MQTGCFVSNRREVPRVAYCIGIALFALGVANQFLVLRHSSGILLTTFVLLSAVSVLVFRKYEQECDAWNGLLLGSAISAIGLVVIFNIFPAPPIRATPRASVFTVSYKPTEPGRV
jgi:hypothetical protein